MPNSSTSSGFLFSRSSSSTKGRPGGVDPNATLKKNPSHRPPPLEIATMNRKNSSWTTYNASSVLDLSDFLKEEPRERARGGGGVGTSSSSTGEQFGLGSAGLLGSLHHQVGQWGENVTRSLLDAPSYRSRSPGSGPPTPRANSTFNPPTRPPSPSPNPIRSTSYSSPRPPPPGSVNTASSSSSLSSSFPSSAYTHCFSSSSSSPAQTPTLTSLTSSFSYSSSFTPSSTLSSFGSLSSSGGPETPPLGSPQPLRSPDSFSSSSDGGGKDKNSEDVLRKLWRKGAETIGRRSSDSGGQLPSPRNDEDLDAPLRPRRSRTSMSRGFSSISSRAGGGIEGGTGLSRRLPKNFESTASEFGTFLRKASFSTSSRSRPCNLEHLSNLSTNPPSPSDPSFLAIPRPPPFFYGGGGSDDDASRTVTPSTTISPELDVPRIRAKFGRSASMSSSGSGDGASVDSWGEGMTEESLERAEIGFGERGRWEWAGFKSPDTTKTGFNLVRGDRSPTDTTSPEWIRPQDREILLSQHRTSPPLDNGRERQLSSTSTLQRLHSRTSSLSDNFTVRNSPSSSPINDQLARSDTSIATPLPPPQLSTPPRSKSTSSSSSSSDSFHFPSSAPHTISLSSTEFRQACNSFRSSHSPSSTSSPSHNPVVAIRIIEATPKPRSNTRPSSSPDSPESHKSFPTRLSPPRTDGNSNSSRGGSTDEEERAWASAKQRFSESSSRRTSGASDNQRLRTLTSESKASTSSPTSSTRSNLLLDESPQLSGSKSFSSLLLRQRKESPSTIPLTQNVLARYYEPSFVFSTEERGREVSVSSTNTVDSDTSFVSVEAEANMLEMLMAQLEESWDDEDEAGGKVEFLMVVEEEEGEEETRLAVEEARGWDWPLPPMREVWREVDERSRRGMQKSIVIDDGVKSFPFDCSAPAPHIFVYHRSSEPETTLPTPTPTTTTLTSNVVESTPNLGSLDRGWRSP